ncbi:MAG: prepilin-type N-terminal cleavage/methylation domain-containing protein [Longimicrobiales bacterium]
MPGDRRGFTLIELLLVLVVIGILATIAMPKYTAIRERSYKASIESDLKVLAIMQELYHKSYLNYSSTVTALPDMETTPDVAISITVSSPFGWAATASHAAVPGKQCGIFTGNTTPADAPPATTEGVITCDP